MLVKKWRSLRQGLGRTSLRKLKSSTGRTSGLAIHAIESLETRQLLTIPVLSSNPAANLIIFLDFDGHTTTGTDWQSPSINRGTIISPAFDTDGNSAIFGLVEQQQIREIWERVAEDFRPFTVNVTTDGSLLAADVDANGQPDRLQRTGISDLYWGMRAVIGGTTSPTGVLGEALLGTFASFYDTPALIYSENIESYVQSTAGITLEKTIAEVVSHEVGHTLGLSHDGQNSIGYYRGHGTGVTSWAPIMGGGEFRNVTQWSDGSYPNANNLEDDLAIITDPSFNGGGWGYGWSGLTYRADDHGNTGSVATVITGSGSILTATGIIERNTDIDAFAFDATPGTVTFNVEPAARGPNLDIYAELYNSAGQLIATSNPTSLLTATISVNVQTSGQYYLRVKGVGKTATANDPGYSNYGSLGAYTVRVTHRDPEDLIGYVSGGFRLAISTGTAFDTSVAASWLPAAWEAIKYGDFNGDGQTDLLGLLNGGWRVGIASNGSFTQTVWAAWADIDWTNVTVGDLNGDGKDDILAREPGTGKWWAALSTGTSFAGATLWTTWANVSWQDAMLADFNGDGKDDLLARTGWGWWVAASTGSAFGGAAAFASWASVAWDTVELADMNGDGRADLVGKYLNNWYVSLSNGTSTAASTSLWASWNSALTWVDGRTGDFNGDGIDDIAARDSTSGIWYVGLSNGVNGSSSTTNWTTWSTTVTWQHVRVGDFNGDGRDDIAGYTNGSWYVGLSNGVSFSNSYWGSWPVTSWQHVAVISALRPSGSSSLMSSSNAMSISSAEGVVSETTLSTNPMMAQNEDRQILLSATRDDNVRLVKRPSEDDIAISNRFGELLFELSDELLTV